MSAPVTNQDQMRPKIFSGSPKKNAAWRSSAKRNGGTRPGAVSTCQARNTATSTASCHTRRLRVEGLIAFHIGGGSGRELLAVALQHFFAQHVPDGLVQLDEARRDAHFGDVARAFEIDTELADGMRGRPGRKHDDAVAHRDRL